MSLTVNRTEEKEGNWADLIDGLRYGGFRRSVSVRGVEAEGNEVGDADDALRGGAARREPTEPEPS